MRWGPWETCPQRWQLRPMGPERERHSSASNTQRDGQQGALWGAAPKAALAASKAMGEPGPLGLLLSSGPGGTGTALDTACVPLTVQSLAADLGSGYPAFLDL